MAESKRVRGWVRVLTLDPRWLGVGSVAGPKGVGDGWGPCLDSNGLGFRSVRVRTQVELKVGPASGSKGVSRCSGLKRLGSSPAPMRLGDRLGSCPDPSGFGSFQVWT